MISKKAPKTNFHTHSLFCDGHASAEDMVRAAVEKDFTILGFSGHSMYPFASAWHMPVNKVADYCTEIRLLQKKYADTIDIQLGFEADYIPGITIPRFDQYKPFSPDYLIGSVHYVFNGKGFFEADGQFEAVSSGIKTVYSGNAKKAVSTYFALEREMLKNGHFSILGHADLIRKTNSRLHFFNEEDNWYRRELKATADAAARAGVIVEINTGAIARGYLKSPYPSDYFLTLLHERNVPVTIDSDAHTPEMLDCAFDDARERAKKAGYTEYAIPTAGSFSFIPL